jgi:hypothetical protein
VWSILSHVSAYKFLNHFRSSSNPSRPPPPLYPSRSLPLPPLSPWHPSPSCLTLMPTYGRKPMPSACHASPWPWHPPMGASQLQLKFLPQVAHLVLHGHHHLLPRGSPHHRDILNGPHVALASFHGSPLALRFHGHGHRRPRHAYLDLEQSHRHHLIALILVAIYERFYSWFYLVSMVFWLQIILLFWKQRNRVLHCDFQVLITLGRSRRHFRANWRKTNKLSHWRQFDRSRLLEPLTSTSMVVAGPYGPAVPCAAAFVSSKGGNFHEGGIREYIPE